jgi:hypothetical protein
MKPRLWTAPKRRFAHRGRLRIFAGAGSKRKNKQRCKKVNGKSFDVTHLLCLYHNASFIRKATDKLRQICGSSFYFLKISLQYIPKGVARHEKENLYRGRRAKYPRADWHVPDERGL